MTRSDDAHSSSSEPAAGELSDADLGADAAARPRQRKTAETLTADPGSDADDTRRVSDEAAWAHHSQREIPPLSLSEGDLIHDGVDPLLDGLRNQLDDQYAWLSHQEMQERQRSYGIEAARLAGVPNTIVRSAKSSRHAGQYAQK